MNDKQATPPPAAPRLTMPSKSLFRPADQFVWTPAVATDIRERFRRIAEQQKESAT